MATAKPRPPFTRAEARRIGNRIGVCWKCVDLGEFVTGMNHELEHGRRAGRALDVTHDSPTVTAKIALAHLEEDPHYYTHAAAAERGRAKPRRRRVLR